MLHLDLKNKKDMNQIIRIEGLDPNKGWDINKIRLVVLDYKNQELGLAVDVRDYAAWLNSNKTIPVPKAFPNLTPTGWTLLEQFKPNVDW